MAHPECASVRPSLVWHLLLSRGPPQLQSPHAMLGIEAHEYVCAAFLRSPRSPAAGSCRRRASPLARALPHSLAHSLTHHHRRAPPHSPPSCSYIEWAESGAGSGAGATDAAPDASCGTLQHLELPIGHTLQAEAAVWEHIKTSLDSYTRRVSAIAGGSAEADGAACALLQKSSVLLGRYEGALLTATTN